MKNTVLSALANLPARTRLLAVAGATAAIALWLGVSLLGAGPAVEAGHGGSHIETLGRGHFTDAVSGQFFLRLTGMHATDVVRLDNASDVVAVKVTIPPGAYIDWHTHPGPGSVVVAQGTLTITYAHDCDQRAYATGEAFLDPGNMVHRADNLGGAEVIAYVTFLGIPPGPATIPAPDPGC